MITTDITPGIQMKFARWMCSTVGSVITIPDPETELDFCLCKFDCDTVEMAFYGEDDDDYENDQTAILIDMLDASSTFDFKLISSDGTETDLDNTNTYGTFFKKGFNLIQPFKAGYLVNWKSVGDTLGPGRYKIQSTQTDFQVDTVKLSHFFQVQTFDERSSNKTVRIKTVNSGTIQNGIDYRGMEWVESVRIPAEFNNYTPELIIDTEEDSLGSPVEIQKKLERSYTLETSPMRAKVLIPIIEDKLMANKIIIDIYDVFSFIQTKKLSVFPDSIEPGAEHSGTSLRKFSITFKATDKIIKRNLC